MNHEPPTGNEEAPWRRVPLRAIYAAELGGRVEWFRIEQAGRATRLGIRVRTSGAEFEFKLRGGAWLRRRNDKAKQ